MSAPNLIYPPSSGGGGGGVSGSGTPNTIPIWSTATSLTDSPLSYAGGTLTYSASVTTQSFGANQIWYVPKNAFALAIGSSGFNATLKLDTNNRFVGVDTPGTPSEKLHVGGGIMTTDAQTSVGSQNGGIIDYDTTNRAVRIYSSRSGTVTDGSIQFWYTTSGGVSTKGAVLDGGGNFGIGEPSPSTYGKLAVTVGTTTLALNADATRADVQSYNKPLAINRLGNNTLMNQGGGYVGIGTASPVTAFANTGTAQGDGANNVSSSGVTWVSNAVGYAAGVVNSSGAVGNGLFVRVNDTSSSTRAFHVTAGATPNSLLFVRADGSVGIGTPSPGQALQVNGGVLVAGAATLGTTATSGTFSAESGSTFRAYTGDGTGWTWAIAKRSASTTTDIVSINDSTNAMTCIGAVRATGTTAGTPALSTPGDTDTGVYFPAANQMRFATGGSPAIAIDASQQVGIGTTSPTAGRSLTTAADIDVYGVRVGRGAGAVATNTAIGASALAANTTGLQNTAIGASALTAVVSGQNNTAIGYGTLPSATGSSNTAIGAGAATNQTTGTNNTSVGHQAGWGTTVNSNNVSVGQNTALYQTGGSNTAVGAQAMLGVLSSSTGQANVAVGASALGSITTGSYNTCAGFSAGSTLTSGSSNICIGTDAVPAAATDSNKLVIGSTLRYVATNGGATTYYATAGALLGYIQIRLNGADVKLPVYAP